MVISSDNPVSPDAPNIGAFGPCAIGIELQSAYQEATRRTLDAREHLLFSCQNMAVCEAYVSEAEVHQRAASGASHLHNAFCLLCKATPAH